MFLKHYFRLIFCCCFFQTKINQGKDESIDLVKANTLRINEMVDKMTETKKLEATLDAKQSNLVILGELQTIKKFVTNLITFLNKFITGRRNGWQY